MSRRGEQLVSEGGQAQGWLCVLRHLESQQVLELPGACRAPWEPLPGFSWAPTARPGQLDSG